MINEKDTKKISKFLSFVLRHNPESIGLVLDANGWANTSDLLEKLNNNSFAATPQILDYVVDTNSKKRFAYNDDKSSIRASQGHSIDIELGLQQAVPPQYLYHGTGAGSVAAILATGIDKRERQHVHLSKDIETAINVGQRHGKPEVLVVAAGQMQADGFTFFLSDNGVWLTNHVPLQYISLRQDDSML